MNFLKVEFQFWIGFVSQILYTWQIVTARGTSLIEIIRAYVTYVIDIYEASFELDFYLIFSTLFSHFFHIYSFLLQLIVQTSLNNRE